MLTSLVSGLENVTSNCLIDVEYLNMPMMESSLKRFMLDQENIVCPCENKEELKRDPQLIWTSSPRQQQQQQQSAVPSIMKSPSMKRRSLIPIIPLRNDEHRKSNRLLLGQVRHHQSHWTLSDDPSKKACNKSHLRRYVSDMFINESEINQKEPHEDAGKLIEAPYRRRSRTFTRKSTATAISVECQEALLDWAKKKWSSTARINLPPPPPPPLPCAKIKNIQSLDVDDKLVQPLHDDLSALEIATTLGLDLNDRYKVVSCYGGFYTGKPHRTMLLLGQNAIYIVLTTNLSLVWSANWTDIKAVSVKWNYSTLSLRSAVSSFDVNFVDPIALRQCASCLDIALRKCRKNNQNHVDSNIVTLETPFQCRSAWHPWMQQHTTQTGADIEYLGLVYFEESMNVNVREKDVTSAKGGHLMYRWSNSSSWHAGYFLIKSGMLHQFHSREDRVPAFRMALNEEECRGYGRNFHSRRPHTVEVNFYRHQSLLLAAACESEAAEWLTAMSQSILMWEDVLPSNPNHLPAACGVIVTDHSVVLFQSDRPVASVALETIPAVMISQQDTFCLMEFECREALDGAGDWILYFQSPESFHDFLQSTRRPRENLPEDTCLKLRKKSLLLRQFSS